MTEFEPKSSSTATLINPLSLSEILSRVLQFVSLWTHTEEYSSCVECDFGGYNSNDKLGFEPRHILACSQVSHLWREHSLQVLYFVFNYYYLNKIPLSILHKNSFRFRIFEDTYMLSTHVFLELSQEQCKQSVSPLMQLIQLTLRNPISHRDLYQILSASPRLKKLEWSTGCEIFKNPIIPQDIVEQISNQSQLAALTLSGWEIPWEELKFLLNSTPMLTKLRLSSMRRDLTRGRSDVSNPPSLSLNSRLTMTLEHPLVLNVTDLVIKVERSTKDSMMDLVRLCPRLTRLGLFLTCLFEVNTLISNLQYLQKQSSRSLPWSLKSIDISVLSSYSDSYFPLIPDEALCSLINCAQWQPDHQQIKEIRLGRGLEKFSADIAFLTKDLVTAIIGEGLPLLPPSSHSQSLSTFQSLSLLPASHLLHESILTDLEIGINSSSTPLNNVRMLREILWSCRRLEKLRIECFCDYLSPPEATLLFCGFDEKGLMDANAAWPCPELRQLKLIGVLILKDMDLIKLAAKDESSSTTNIANVSRGNEEQVSESWMQPQIETGTVEENDTIKIIPEQEEQEEQEQEEQEEDQEEQASYGEDYDEYNYDTWDYDERSGRLDDPALARFADQIIAQVARLPKLDVLILNGTNYTDEITLFRAQKIVQ